MFDIQQLASIHKIASFCVANIANNDDFALHADSEPVAIAYRLHDLISDQETNRSPMIADVMFNLFSIYLQTVPNYKRDTKFSEQDSLEHLKQEALRAEKTLQKIRIKNSVEDYMRMFVVINTVSYLIQQKERQNIAANLTNVFGECADVARIKQEILSLVQIENLDLNSQHVRNMFALHDFALRNTLAYNAQFIRSAYDDEYKKSLVFKLIASCKKRADCLSSRNLDNSNELELHLCQLERKALIALRSYARATIAFANLSDNVVVNAMDVFGWANRVRKNEIFDEVEYVFAIPEMMQQTIQCVADFILQAANRSATEENLKFIARYLFLAIQYLNVVDLNLLLKGLRDWQLCLSGKALQIVLDCKLELEKAYVDCLECKDLKDYYDFIISETNEIGLKFNQYWDVADRLNDELAKTPQGKRQDRQRVIRHDQKLQKYVVSKLNELLAIDWYTAPYKPVYTQDTHPNPRPNINLVQVPPPGSTETAIVVFSQKRFNLYMYEQYLIAALDAVKIRAAASTSFDSDSEDEELIGLMSANSANSDDDLETVGIQRPDTPAPIYR